MTKKLSFAARAVSRFYLDMLNIHALDVIKAIDSQPEINPSGVYMLDGNWSRLVKLQPPGKLNIDYYRQQFKGKLLCLEFNKTTLLNGFLNLDNTNVEVISLYHYNLRMYAFQLGRQYHALHSDKPATDALLLIWLPSWVQFWL